MSIEALCRNQRVLVVGSGPNYSRIEDSEFDISIGANGGVSLQPCNILCTTSYLFRDEGITESEFEIRRSMMGHRFKSIWLYTGNGSIDMIATLKVMGRFNLFRTISGTEMRVCDMRKRNHIIKKACGVELRVSTGVFAICLALYSQAKSVQVTGIGLTDGHTGQTTDSIRDHKAEDRQCLNLLLDGKYHGRIILDERLVSQL